MWCRHCQQETPALGPITSYGARCPRCNRSEHSADHDIENSSSTQSHESTTSELECDAFPVASSAVTRRHIRRSLQAAESTVTAGGTTNTFRLDLGSLEIPTGFGSTAGGFTGVAAPIGEQKDLAACKRDASIARSENNQLPRQSIAALRQSRKHVAKKSSGWGQIFGWGVATCGAMLLGLGIGLIIWATYGGRTLLWGPAIATTIAGQGLMIVGLLQLLANLWSAARHTSAKLTQIHDDLRRVRRTTEEASGRHQATASGFYAELSSGATSDVLLGNLRGQLDQLSARIRIDH